MKEGIPRPVLALAAIVALVVVSIAIKDYFQKPKEAQSVASTSPSDAQSNAKAAAKKINSTKHRRVRTSALAENSVNTAYPAADDIEKPAIDRQSVGADNAGSTLNQYAENAAADQASHADTDAAVEGHTRPGDVVKAKLVKFVFSAPKCVPLPNLVMRQDVDAPYYENWAREYSCQLR